MTQAISVLNKVNCYIRRTKIWAEQYEFSNDIYFNIWKSNHIAKMWDETFNISYVDFRKQLNCIQQENIKEIAFDNVINQFEYFDNNTSIMVPTDDDDWFHPNIISKLLSFCKPIMFWNFINF